MWWLYLDESGDLGFDFVNKKPSNHFTICILATSHKTSNTQFKTAVKRTLKNKLNHGNKKKRIIEELHATSTSLGIKKYAWRQVENKTFGIYSLTLNKRRLYKNLAQNKHRTYNYIARKVIDELPFEKADGGVQLIVDKSKGKTHIWEFNEYIRTQLEGRISPDVSLDFIHVNSKNSPGVQFADMFAWGVFQKYERKNLEWYNIFKGKIQHDEQYL